MTADATALQWHAYAPKRTPHPGVTLRETLEALNMSQSKLSTRTGLTQKHINQIIQGNASISPATALLLERATGVPADLWNNLESRYQDLKLRQEEAVELAERASWLERVPVTELRKRGFITATMRDKGLLVQQVMEFFGVGSLDAWEQTWNRPAAAFLQSSAYEINAGAVAAWLRLGEIAASKQDREYGEFDKAALRAALPGLRALTLERPKDFFPKLTQICADIGIAVVLVPDIPGTRASGATRFLSPQRALVQLSNRGKRNDKFWFAFFHELAHLLLHGKKGTFVHIDPNGDSSPDTGYEQEANDYAGRLLIPSEAEARLRAIRTPDEAQRLASDIGVAPGIVAGRVQRETQDWTFGMSLCTKFELKTRT
ncbi:HigA family addiction module antitoxin [Demequina globuliformis]|uniref:HigA family addiction module antitoxin n=1 Tax=Demequina globuliformis TaxID=676202 RepID=UPI000784E41B|nr:HigA family addiction module antitoxin [Demequina globuliformis]